MGRESAELSDAPETHSKTRGVARTRFLAALGLFLLWVAVLAGMAVVFLFLARRSLRYIERLAKEEGKLIVRWQ
jgi:hypothetical protein